MAKIVIRKLLPFVIPMPILDEEVPSQSSIFVMPDGDVFLARGLAMWGISDETKVQISIGNNCVFPAPVTAQMFAHGLSFQELYQGLKLEEGRGVELPKELWREFQVKTQWRAIEPGLIPAFMQNERIELSIHGPVKAALFWGFLSTVFRRRSPQQPRPSIVGVDVAHPSPSSFGRFHYYGSVGTVAHYWSTTDPPIYGAKIGLDSLGSVRVVAAGEKDSSPTMEEIERAQRMVRIGACPECPQCGAPTTTDPERRQVQGGLCDLCSKESR